MWIPATLSWWSMPTKSASPAIRPTTKSIFDTRAIQGISETTFAKMQGKFPGRALEIAVKGMLPKGPLGYAMIKKLKIYAGESHPHTAQQPKPLALH